MLAQELAKTLGGLGYKSGKDEKGLAHKIQWAVEYERSCDFLAWIAANLDAKNALTDDELYQYQQIPDSMDDAQLESLLQLDGNEETVEDLEREILELKSQLKPTQETIESLEFKRSQQMQLTQDLQFQVSSSNVSIKKLEMASRELDQKILLENSRNDAQLKALSTAVSDFVNSFSQLKETQYLSAMENELKLFDNQDNQLNQLILKYLEYTPDLLQNGQNSVTEKNQELELLHKNCAITQMNYLEAKAELEKDQIMLATVQRQITLMETLVSTHTDVLKLETEQRRNEIKLLKENIQEVNQSSMEIFQQLARATIAPILIVHFDHVIHQATNAIAKLDQGIKFLSEKYHRNQCLTLAFHVELKDHLKALYLLGNLLRFLSKKHQLHQERMVAFNPNTDHVDDSKVIHPNDEFLLSVHKSLLQEKHNENLSSVLIPISSLSTNAKRLMDDLNATNAAVQEMEKQVQGLLNSMERASEKIVMSVFQGKSIGMSQNSDSANNSQDILMQPVLTPPLLADYQMLLQSQTDSLQPKLRNLLQEMETSEELKIQTQLFQWFYNDPARLQEHIKSLEAKLN